MSSSSPTLTFRLVASPPVVRLASSVYRSKALNFSFPKSSGASREVHSLFRYVLNSNPLPSPVLFRVCFGLYLTSAATDYISEIILTTRFYFRPSRVSRCACCLATCHVLLLSLFGVSSCCTVPPASISTFNIAFRRHQKPLSNAPARVLNNCQSSK